MEIESLLGDVEREGEALGRGTQRAPHPQHLQLEGSTGEAVVQASILEHHLGYLP